MMKNTENSKRLLEAKKHPVPTRRRRIAPSENLDCPTLLTNAS
jgi:hypothetical protein